MDTIDLMENTTVASNMSTVSEGETNLTTVEPTDIPESKPPVDLPTTTTNGPPTIEMPVKQDVPHFDDSGFDMALQKLGGKTFVLIHGWLY